MQPFILSRVAALIVFATVGLTAPAVTNITQCADPWASWSLVCAGAKAHHFYCDNLPGVIAGTGARTKFDPSLTASLLILPNSDSGDSDHSAFCEPDTNTFVVPAFGAANPAVQNLLVTALANVQRTIDGGDTGLIPDGGWRFLGRNAVSMVVYSMDVHKVTYEILHSAIDALIRWMRRPGRTFGSCTFTVWDGAYMVGHGRISA